MGPWLLSLRLLLAATFAAAGCAKAIDGEATRRAVSDFGVPARLTPPAAILLPLNELAVAVLLVPPWSARWGAGLACGLLLIFSAAIVVNLVRGRRPACGCFGQLHARPLSGWTLARNILLAAAAGLIAFPGVNAVARWPWGAPAVFTRPGVLAAVAVAAGALLVFELWLIAHLFRQRGRLLLRLDAIERHLGLGGAPPDSLRSISGLPIGATAPGFEARTLAGAHTTLERLRRRGRPVLLLFADPLCPACARMWPALRGWTHDYARAFTFAIVARQAAADRLRAEALEGVDVVMQEGDEVARPYGATMTPAAVLVRTDGTIGSDVPIGFEAIRALVVARGGALT